MQGCTSALRVYMFGVCTYVACHATPFHAMIGKLCAVLVEIISLTRS